MKLATILDLVQLATHHIHDYNGNNSLHESVIVRTAKRHINSDPHGILCRANKLGATTTTTIKHHIYQITQTKFPKFE